jgi:hypothetical protein
LTTLRDDLNITNTSVFTNMGDKKKGLIKAMSTLMQNTDLVVGTFTKTFTRNTKEKHSKMFFGPLQGLAIFLLLRKIWTSYRFTVKRNLNGWKNCGQILGLRPSSMIFLNVICC